MSNSLNKNSMMECSRHGTRRPSFICHHLQFGEGIGFVESEDEFDPEWPFKNAWCGECDKIFREQGEWNDISEGHAQIMAICEGCYEEIKERNE
jgi:hypothetical protein